MPKDKHWQRSRAQDAVIRDLIRLQNAPPKDGEVTELYLEIKKAVSALGLPESDAAWFYRKMQRDQWKICGIPVEDWRETIISMHRAEFFPSQR